MRHGLAIAFALSLAACGPTLRGEAVLYDSPFEQEATIEGVELTYTRPRSESETFSLRSFIDKNTAAVRHQLYVRGFHRRAWYAANDETAKPLEFTRIGSGKRYSHHFGAILPEETLRSRRYHGYGVKFYSKDGATQVVRLTPEQIGAQLDAVDAARRRFSPGFAATGGPASASPAPPMERVAPR